MSSRPVRLSLLLMTITVVAGLAVRFAPLGLPYFVVKYGGSALWALMVYWVASTLLPTKPVLAVCLLACGLTAVVEFVKLIYWPPLDAFRRTLPGILLLGRLFSFWDIVVYWLAIAVGALVDRRLRSRNGAAVEEP